MQHKCFTMPPIHLMVVGGAMLFLLIQYKVFLVCV